MIMRMILVNVPVEKAAEAQRLWKNECAPLMIKQSGCISEQLLRGRDNDSEFISVSTWEDQASIDRYRASNEALAKRRDLPLAMHGYPMPRDRG